MRIGILTQPLSENYGGLLQNFALQNFALQTVLTKMGHEGWTIDRQYKRKSFIDKFIILLNELIPSKVSFENFISPKLLNIIPPIDFASSCLIEFAELMKTAFLGRSK